MSESNLSELEAKRLWVEQLLNQIGNDVKLCVNEAFEEIKECGHVEIDCKEYTECANISTKRMYIMLLHAEQHLLENTVDKTLILSLLDSVKHDVLMLNDKDNSIERDLYR